MLITYLMKPTLAVDPRSIAFHASGFQESWFATKTWSSTSFLSFFTFSFLSLTFLSLTWVRDVSEGQNEKENKSHTIIFKNMKNRISAYLSDNFIMTKANWGKTIKIQYVSSKDFTKTSLMIFPNILVFPSKCIVHTTKNSNLGSRIILWRIFLWSRLLI